MVSGFFTSPWDHWRMSSAVARPMRSSSKKLTSSTVPSLYFTLAKRLLRISQGRWGASTAASCPPYSLPSDFFDRAGLTPGQVDAELFRSAEHVLVGLAHLDGDAVAGEHLDVEAQRLHLLDEHLERLGDSGLRDVLALD